MIKCGQESIAYNTIYFPGFIPLYIDSINLSRQLITRRLYYIKLKIIEVFAVALLRCQHYELDMLLLGTLT